jgi:putative tryptophan/tyrosine transport system substrate-binding protein
MRRRNFVTMLGTASLWALAANAQQGNKIARLGFLGPAPASNYAPRVDALRRGLTDLGYVEGKNLVIEFRWFDRVAELPELAAELLRQNVDVVFASSSTEVGALAQVTTTTPVVFATHADPVGVGHVASLAKPGGNITGLTMLLTDLAAKEVEIFREALPYANLIGVVYTTAAPSHLPALQAVAAAAERLGVRIKLVSVQSAGDFEAAFQTMAQDRLDGFLVIASSLSFSTRDFIAELALKHRLPSMFGTRDNVAAGGLMSYAPDHRDLTRRAATYIDAILKGTKPADLPVQQASKYELVINLKTADALGVKLPESFLLRANEIIE